MSPPSLPRAKEFKFKNCIQLIILAFFFVAATGYQSVNKAEVQPFSFFWLENVLEAFVL